jgi:prepilin-type N-terminal cleavage/methylation domain-containing protein
VIPAQDATPDVHKQTERVIKMHLMNKKSFTLLEMIIVIVIIGILAGVALPNYMKTKEKAYAAEAWINLQSLMTLSKAYYLENNAWPVIGSLSPNPNNNPGKRFTYDVWPDVLGNPGYEVYCYNADASVYYLVGCRDCGSTGEYMQRWHYFNGGWHLLN